MPKLRANFYFDGYNFYHGICDTGDKTRLWIDIVSLSRSILLRKDEKLNAIHYYTAAPKTDTAKIQRYRTFIALLSDFKWTVGATNERRIVIHEGLYSSHPHQCKNCGHSYSKHEEKQSDVALGTQLVRDALLDEYDVAYIIAADSDYVPAISMVKAETPAKQVKVWFPPMRYSKDLQTVADMHRTVHAAIIDSHKLEEEHELSDGTILKRPAVWLSTLQSSTPHPVYAPPGASRS